MTGALSNHYHFENFKKLRSTIEAMNKRYNNANNPALMDQANNENSQLSNQLKNEKKQKNILHNQLETMRTQLNLQNKGLQIKETQIQGKN